MNGIFTIQKAQKWDNVSVAINTDWFASDIGSEVRPGKRGFQEYYNAPVKHSIQIMVPTESVVKVIGTLGGITKTLELNNGLSLGANNIYIFDIIVHVGFTYNLQHLTGTQNPMCLITESFNCDI